ncbi:MAG: hypothetical protein MJA29_06610, partial [Candidatus Omnitrophica bacterium]|nr:hypothetical protein [Candidatus Omnitrophota bacterium]
MAKKKPQYSLNADGEFVIRNYNHAKPFSNFFPGIAGRYGIPMWVFYVNRGQAISSCGTTSKDRAIMEFFPANRAWQTVSSHGFRSFLKVRSGGREFIYEPFQNGLMNRRFSLQNCMRLSSSELVIEEHNRTLGLTVTVTYFTIPEDSYAGLARVVGIRNTSRSRKTIPFVDGMAQIVPYGTNNFFLKKMGHTIQAWMQV